MLALRGKGRIPMNPALLLPEGGALTGTNPISRPEDLKACPA